MSRPASRRSLTTLVVTVMAGSPVAAGQAPVVTARDGEARNFEIEPKQRTLYGKSVRRLLGKTLAWAAHTVVLPVRGVAYLQGRWKVFTRIRDVFQNDAGTLAIHPLGAYSTAFGATLGARAFYKDFGGNAERITVSAARGGAVVKALEATVELPRVLGTRWYVESGVRWEENINQYFAGIGNGEVTTGMELDARDAEVASRFAQERFLAAARTGVNLDRPGRRLRAGTTIIYNDRTFGPAPDSMESIDLIYDTTTVPGFDTGFGTVETTLDVEVDTRDTLGPTSAGGVARVFAGGASVLGRDVRYAHYGVELAYFVSPFWKDRVVVGRVVHEGAREIDGDLPFTELPRLGGTRRLRGYPGDRFRDRLATIGTLEYHYPIHANFTGHVFAEVGKVAQTYDELVTTGLADWHLAYGGGLIVHTTTQIKIRLDLAFGEGLQVYFTTDILDAFRDREREL